MSTNFNAETNLKNYSSQYCNAEQDQFSAVYLGMEVPIFLKYFIPIYLNLKHIQSITTVKQIFQFCLYAIFLVLVFKRASLCNWQHLDFQFFYRF